ncbi:MAG: LysR family transcriptional regulator [Arenicella sp.]
MRYTLRQLEVFLEVARSGSLTAASNELAMSQSAASGALKELELRFDTQLFDRVGKRLKINPSGRALQTKAEELLQRASDLEATLIKQGEFGSIKVGATMTIGNYLFVDMFTEFKQKYPQANVDLSVGNTREIVDKVLNYQVDVGLIEGEVNEPDIDVIPWRNDEMVIVCSPEHPLADCTEELTRDQLVKLDWIVREKGSGTRQTFERGMYGILQDLNYVLELEQIEAMKRAVTLNLGVSCLSKSSVEHEINRGDLVELTVKDRQFTRYFYVVLHRDKFLTDDVEKWLDYCGLRVEEIFFFREQA